MKLRLLFLALAANLPSLSSVTLFGPSLSPARDSIVVSILAPRPPLDAVLKVSVWQVVAKPQGAAIGAFVDIDRVEQADPKISYLVTGQVRLIFKKPLTELPESVDVILT